jgi:hypothetical protein
MANVRDCNLPDDLYYLVEKHVWAKPMGGGVVRVGITVVASKLSGGKLAALTVKGKAIGLEVKQAKSVKRSRAVSSSALSPPRSPASCCAPTRSWPAIRTWLCLIHMARVG